MLTFPCRYTYGDDAGRGGPLLLSPERDISTRAVCDAVGVGAPVLFRLFGDKNGLLAAVVDRTFQRSLALKRAQKLSDDPVNDLYSASDAHIAFALKIRPFIASRTPRR